MSSEPAPFRSPLHVIKEASTAPGAPARPLRKTTGTSDVLADGGPPKIPRKKSTVRGCLCFVDEDQLSHGTGGESSTAMDAATNEYAKKCKTPGPTPGEKRKKTPATAMGIGCCAVNKRRKKSRHRHNKFNPASDFTIKHFKDIKEVVGAQVKKITRNIM